MNFEKPPEQQPSVEEAERQKIYQEAKKLLVPHYDEEETLAEWGDDMEPEEREKLERQLEEKKLKDEKSLELFTKEHGAKLVESAMNEMRDKIDKNGYPEEIEGIESWYLRPLAKKSNIVLDEKLISELKKEGYRKGVDLKIRDVKKEQQEMEEKEKRRLANMPWLLRKAYGKSPFWTEDRKMIRFIAENALKRIRDYIEKGKIEATDDLKKELDGLKTLSIYGTLSP